MRFVRAAVAVVLAVLLGGVCASPAIALASRPVQRRVILVIPTGLKWDDITATGTPTMWRLASQEAVGNLSARSRVREPHEPVSALEGALDLSAGTWATPEYSALGSFQASEPVAGTDAATLFRRNNGTALTGHASGFLDFATVKRVNAGKPDAAHLGTLGAAIHQAGGSTSAIGNSDAGDPVGGFKFVRPAGAVAMDERGLVDYGDVSRALLASAPLSPYGVRTDLAALDQALSQAEASAATHGGPALFVLDPGDEYRARRYAPRLAEPLAKLVHQRAVREADDVVGIALRHARPDDVVVVAVQAPSDEAPGTQGFAPLLVSGGGLLGYLSSPSTHRVGEAANPDVTAFVLASLGARQPLDAIGTPLNAVASADSAAERIARLRASDKTAVATAAMSTRFATAYIAAFLALVIAMAVLLEFGRRMRGPIARFAAYALGAGALLGLSVPAATWLMFVGTPSVRSSAAAWISLGTTSLIVWVAALIAWRVWGGRAALALLTALTVVLLVVDQLLGAPLSVSTLLGYSPLQAARFYGIGNEAAALLVGSSLAGLALVLDDWRDARWAGSLRRYGIPLVGAVVVVTCAAPFLGANVGVALWGTLGFTVLWMRANDRRLTWRFALTALLVVVLAVSLFAAIDLLGRGTQTHLARALNGARSGGLGQLRTLVARKAATNARVLATSRWSLMLLGTLGLLGFAWARAADTLRRLFAENTTFVAALVAASSAGVLGFLTEDTGILVPTFLLLPVGLCLVWLLAETQLHAADARPESAATTSSPPTARA